MRKKVGGRVEEFGVRSYCFRVGNSQLESYDFSFL
jgi:hypothetical protein